MEPFSKRRSPTGSAYYILNVAMHVLHTFLVWFKHNRLPLGQIQVFSPILLKSSMIEALLERLMRKKIYRNATSDVIFSGEFSKHQAPLDQDNAHLILAEAVINSTTSGKVNGIGAVAANLIN